MRTPDGILGAALTDEHGSIRLQCTCIYSGIPDRLKGDKVGLESRKAVDAMAEPRTGFSAIDADLVSFTPQSSAEQRIGASDHKG